ncbi:hypothetical protein Ct9H90mP29_05080 [bacterium]|nr:MAG: hypothetical protein Ct9H90mP29_05080 [bacterium]
MGYKGVVFNKKNDMTLPSDRLVILGVVGCFQNYIGRVGLLSLGRPHYWIHNVMEPAIARLAALFWGQVSSCT